MTKFTPPERLVLIEALREARDVMKRSIVRKELEQAGLPVAPYEAYEQIGPYMWQFVLLTKQEVLENVMEDQMEDQIEE
jgi:hypothetical protein